MTDLTRLSHDIGLVMNIGIKKPRIGEIVNADGVRYVVVNIDEDPRGTALYLREEQDERRSQVSIMLADVSWSNARHVWRVR